MLDLIEGVVPVVGIIIGVILVLSAVLHMWKKVPQDKAGVVTGLKKRVITGGGGLVVPVLERIDYISLGNIPLEVASKNSLSSQGVPINVKTTAVIKVKNETESILSAIEQFVGENEQAVTLNIRGTAEAVLEGKLREIIATMTVEDLYNKREDFSSKVQEVVGTEFSTMGLEVKNFTITDISDDNGYIAALGVGMIAQRKRDADIQKAEAERDTQIKTSEAKKDGEAAQLLSEMLISQSKKEKEVQEAGYRREGEAAKAKADAAYEIQKNITQIEVTQAEMDAELLKQQRQKEIKEAEIQIQIVAEEKNIELADKKTEQRKRALQADVVEPANAAREKQMAEADADKYKSIADAQAKAEAKKADANAEAEAIRIKASAEAEATKQRGLAEAEATKAKGLAEAESIKARGLADAEAMEKKAEAYRKYGEAAMMEMMVKILPDMAREIARPLESIEKITIIEGGEGGQSGVSQMGSYVPSVLAKTFEAMKETIGFDPVDIMKANTYEAKVNRNLNVSGVDMNAAAMAGVEMLLDEQPKPSEKPAQEP